MSLQVFKYQMNMGAGAEVRHNVTKTQFGDGYAQRVSHGINNKRTDWSGTKVGDYETVIKPIADFLDAHGGVKPFLWTNPHGETKQYVCQDYQVTQRKGNFWQISLKFEQSNSDGSSAPLLDFSNQNSGTPNLPQSALTAINLALQDEIERSTQKDDAHDIAIQSLNTSKTSLSKAIDEIKEQLASVSSAPASVTWDSITGKPSSFNPSSHSHNWNDITNKPSSFTPSVHTHRASDISDLQTILSKYATKDEIPQINTDDLTIDTSNLATKSSVDELTRQVANKADLSELKKVEHKANSVEYHLATKANQSELTQINQNIATNTYNIGTKANLVHSHTIAQVTGLSQALDDKANKNELANYALKSEISSQSGGSGGTLNKSETGYQIFESGLIIQWGRFINSWSSNAQFTFPVSFPSHCIAVIPVLDESLGRVLTKTPFPEYITNRGFFLRMLVVSQQGSSYDSYPVRWIALGY